ncbi:AbrB family transcriptional regulator [Azospirillum sp. YIM B02556]|uniref:AbrB family transcriptional regulator n=1 Tax=Azospirillum endophyticum TaxID=2800326 RepID=A0ABS1F1L5_9PROT|nr:AbrB family transcriptional regulator [Azospirillum endophyticum]MBK1837306.1 AbrB family transcriptional regulator [Azospirillum endophyticum]
MRKFGQWAGLLALSAAVTLGLGQTGLPAAWLIGPMIAAIALGVGGASIRVPPSGFTMAQAIIGCLVAHAVTSSILLSIARNWPLMLGTVGLTVLVSGIVGWLFVRYGSLPGTTAAWGVSPGAAAAMVAMAGEHGADARLVAVMQYLRVVLVVLSASLVTHALAAGPQGADVPVAPVEALDLRGLAATLLVAGIGGWIGHRFRIPSGALLVPMVLGALVQSGAGVTLQLPNALLTVTYTVIGWSIGLRFTREVLRHALRAVPQMLLSTGLMIALCSLSAWVLVTLLPTDPLTAFLATSPGGLDSVVVIALGSGVDLPLVLALQTLRLFVVVLSGPPLARLIARYA